MGETSFRTPVAKNLRVEDLLRIYDEVMPDVEALLRSAQLTPAGRLPETPSGLQGVLTWSKDGEPQAPDDITGMPLLQLGQLFSFMTAWTNYIAMESTRSKSFLEVQEQHLSIIKSALTLFYREQGAPVSTVPDLVNTDERYVLQHAIYVKTLVAWRMMESKHEQFKRLLNNISREQSRRAEELGQQLGRPGRTKPNRGGRDFG